jgi:hypothetical protein
MDVNNELCADESSTTHVKENRHDGFYASALYMVRPGRHLADLGIAAWPGECVCPAFSASIPWLHDLLWV